MAAAFSEGCGGLGCVRPEQHPSGQGAWLPRGSSRPRDSGLASAGWAAQDQRLQRMCLPEEALQLSSGSLQELGAKNMLFVIAGNIVCGFMVRKY